MYCRRCGKQIRDGIRFCPFCGTATGKEINAADVPNNVQEVQQNNVPNNTQIVQQNNIPNNAQPMQQNYEKPKKPKKSRKGLIIGIVCGVLVLALVGTGIGLFATGFAQKTIATMKAERYVKNEEYEKAIKCYEELLELDDANEEIYLTLANLYMEIEDFEGALDVLERGMKKIRRPSDKFNDVYEKLFALFEGPSDSKETTTEDEDENQGAAADSGVINYDSLSKAAADRTAVNVSLVSTDVSDFPLVRLYLDVTDYSGEQIELTVPQGAIKEAVSGGEYVEREVKRIERLEGNEGLSIELIADKSGSMDARMSQVKGVMSEFVNSLDYVSGDQVELIAFDTYVMYMCTRTNNTGLLNNGINNMMPTGSTALYDALFEGVINAGFQPGARCVIAFTDGGDNESIHTYQEIINLAQQSSVAIYIIGTDKSTESILENIAFSTNGYYWYIDDLADMGDIFDEIYEEQKDLYCLEYVSDTSIDAYLDRNVDFIIGDNKVTANLTASFTPVETLEVQTHASRYEIIPADISWTAATTECIRRGGHLATITSEDEMNQLIALAEASGLKYLWVGGYTSVNGSQAFGHWVTGEPFDYTAWYEGEPSRNDMDGTPEMYLMMWKLNDAWSWNDQRNDPAADLSYFIGNIGYICEYEQ